MCIKIEGLYTALKTFFLEYDFIHLSPEVSTCKI